MLDPISLMPVGNAYSLGSVDVFSTDTNSLTALPSNKNSSLSSEYKIGDPLTSIPLALDNNVFTPTNDTQRSDGSVKISKDKKDKNKEKNAYISPKLAEIFGDNETVRIKAGGREIKDYLLEILTILTCFNLVVWEIIFPIRSIYPMANMKLI